MIGSLLKTIQDHGFELSGVDDGDGNATQLKGTPREQRQRAKEIIDSVDESHLYVTKDEKTFWIFIVLGNDPEETVADYTSNAGLDKAFDEFANKWAGKPCPTK